MTATTLFHFLSTHRVHGNIASEILVLHSRVKRFHLTESAEILVLHSQTQKTSHLKEPVDILSALPQARAQSPRLLLQQFPLLKVGHSGNSCSSPRSWLPPPIRWATRWHGTWSIEPEPPGHQERRLPRAPGECPVFFVFPLHCETGTAPPVFHVLSLLSPPLDVSPLHHSPPSPLLPLPSPPAPLPPPIHHTTSPPPTTPLLPHSSLLPPRHNHTPTPTPLFHVFDETWDIFPGQYPGGLGFLSLRGFAPPQHAACGRGHRPSPATAEGKGAGWRDYFHTYNYPRIFTH